LGPHANNFVSQNPMAGRKQYFT